MAVLTAATVFPWFLSAPTVSAQQRENVRVVSQVDGRCYALDVQGDYAYVGEGTRLTILDVSDPTLPRPMGKVNLTALGTEILRSISVSGNRAAAVGWAEWIAYIVDVSDPWRPYVATTWTSPDTIIRHVHLAGDRLYAVSQSLWVVDISDPSSPTVSGVYQPPPPSYIQAVQTVGDMAFLATNTGLRIIDFSDPSSPTLLGLLDTPSWAVDLEVFAEKAYLACRTDGLLVVDVSNPSTPVLRGVWGDAQSAIAVAVSGNIACVSGDAGNRTWVVDVGNSAAPIARGSFPVANARVMVENRVFCAAAYDGAVIVDVQNPSMPQIVGTYVTPSSPRDVFVSNRQVYVANTEAGCKHFVLTVEHAWEPMTLGRFDVPICVSNGLYVSDSIAYTGGGRQLVLTDCRDPRAPQRLIEFAMPHRVTDVYVSGGLSCCAHGLSDSRNGVSFVDVSDPTSPSLRGFCETPLDAMDVVLFGDFAYVGCWDPRTTTTPPVLCIVDAQNPWNPRLVGSLPLGGHVFVSGHRLYVGSAERGLEILDLSNPSSPTQRGAWVGRGGDVHVADGFAYLAVELFGVKVVDVTDPTSPTLRGFFETPTLHGRVHVAERLAYLATGQDLWILEYTGPRARAGRWTLYDANSP